MNKRSLAQVEAELKQAQERIQELEKKLHSHEVQPANHLAFNDLFSNAPLNSIIYKLIKDARGRIVDWKVVQANQLGAASLGMTPEDLIGKSAVELFGLEVMNPYIAISQELSDTGGHRLFETFFESNQRYYLTSVFMVGTEHYANIAVDQTEQKMAEHARSESEALYRLLYETMLQGVVFQNAEGQIIHANPAAERILGLTLDQMQGRTSVDPRWHSVREDYSAFPGGDHPAMLALQSGRPVLNTIMGVFNAEENAYRWININAIPRFDGRNKKPFQVYTTFEDISERKLADEAFRKSQALLKESQRIGRIGYLEWSAADPTSYCSDELFEILDLPTGTPIRYETIEQMMLPEDHERVNRAAAEQLSKLIPKMEMEYRITTSRGNERYLHQTWDITYGQDGKPVRLMNIFQDISERKLNEESLRASEEKYRGLMESLDSLVFTVDYDGDIVFVNDTAAEVMGGTRSDLIGRSIKDIFRGHHSHARLGVIQNIFETDHSLAFEMLGRGRQGEERWYRVSLQPLHDKNGRVIQVLGSAIDINDLKTAQQELIDLNRTLEERVQERSAQVQDLYDNAPVGYHTTDINRQIISMNQTELKMLGYAREELIGRHRSMIFAEEDHEDLDLNFRNLIETGRTVDLEAMAKRKDGTKFPVIINATAIYDENGNFVSSRSTLTDITERKRAEEIIRRTNHELEHALRAKDEFLASMSHELRTPLTGILGLTESLQLNIYGDLNDRQRSSLQRIEASGHHLLSLINDILDLSKIEAGKLGIQISLCSLEDICQSALQMVHGMAEQKRQSIEYTPPPRPLQIEADERRIKQILVNLLINAIKFTPQDGELGLRVEPNEERSQVRLVIWDRGIGIQQHNLSKLFQPFTQIDSSLAREYAGTGLGLSLVRRLAELHGGSVSVDSVFGEGSRFTVSLPLKATNDDGEQSLESNPKQLVQTAATNPARLIVIVDDNSILQDVFADYLEMHGYWTQRFGGGLEMLDQLFSLRPSLVLMDIQMPGMDGLEVIRRIRSDADPFIASIPIIAVTALAMPGDRERCIAAGANEYLSKPISLQLLLDTVNRQLEA